MKRLFLLAGTRAVLAFVLAWTAVAASAAAVSAQQFTLSNGMTLIVQPDRRAPTVAHMLWVRVGAMDEVDGSSGVAHVLEHMMFKGTPDLKPGEFSRRMAALGGRENAFTSRDATAYHQQVASQHLEAVMRLEADRFARNQWADDEFRKEIEVIKEERRQLPLCSDQWGVSGDQPCLRARWQRHTTLIQFRGTACSDRRKNVYRSACPLRCECQRQRL